MPAKKLKMELLVVLLGLLGGAAWGIYTLYLVFGAPTPREVTTRVSPDGSMKARLLELPGLGDSNYHIEVERQADPPRVVIDRTPDYD
ncbi:MAG: hypothetical protein HY319_28555 [Armatimonadetes bacterium]|nr:hypothetical protein [Armatimonadota bacterium]